jgi:hypothetical protein
MQCVKLLYVRRWPEHAAFSTGDARFVKPSGLLTAIADVLDSPNAPAITKTAVM